MGNGDVAVDLALEAARYAPPNSRFAATAATFAGYGHALNRDAVNSGRSFQKARVILQHLDDDPYWGFFLDEQYVSLHEAHAVAALGNHQAAAKQFADAISVMQSGYPRDKGVYLGRQALAHMYAGEIEPAAKIGKKALTVGAETGSARILHEVSLLESMIDPRSRQSGVAEFRDAAGTIEA